MLNRILVFLFFLAPCLGAHEQMPAAKKITVLVKPAQPFAFDKGGALAGYSVDLWKRVAAEARTVVEILHCHEPLSEVATGGRSF